MAHKPIFDKPRSSKVPRSASEKMRMSHARMLKESSASTKKALSAPQLGSPPRGPRSPDVTPSYR